MRGDLAAEALQDHDCPTMADVRAAETVEEKMRLLHRRAKSKKQAKRDDYRFRYSQPAAKDASRARKARIAKYGSAWQRARQAESRNMAQLNARATAAARFRYNRRR